MAENTSKPTKVARIIDKYTIVINKGTKNKISKGDMFLIYRLGDEIVDPDTKEILGTLEIVVGMGKVEHAQDTIATLTSCKTKKAPPLKKFRDEAKFLKKLRGSTRIPL